MLRANGKFEAYSGQFLTHKHVIQHKEREREREKERVIPRSISIIRLQVPYTCI